MLGLLGDVKLSGRRVIGKPCVVGVSIFWLSFSIEVDVLFSELVIWISMGLGLPATVNYLYSHKWS